MMADYASTQYVRPFNCAGLDLRRRRTGLTAASYRPRIAARKRGRCLGPHHPLAEVCEAERAGWEAEVRIQGDHGHLQVSLRKFPSFPSREIPSAVP